MSVVLCVMYIVPFDLMHLMLYVNECMTVIINTNVS